MEERTAIELIRRGDIRGLETLVHKYQEQAVKVAFMITRNRPQAEDVVQEAFLRIFRRIQQYDTTRPFKSWFLRIVVNDSLKLVSRSREVSIDGHEGVSLSDVLPDLSPNPQSVVEAAELSEKIWEALGKLPPKQRAVIIFRYYLDMDDEEIAAATTSPHSTIRWRLHAAHQQLRRLLLRFSYEGGN